MPGWIFGEGGRRFGTLPSEFVRPAAMCSQASPLSGTCRSNMISTPSAGWPLAVSRTWLVIGEVSGLPSADEDVFLGWSGLGLFNFPRHWSDLKLYKMQRW